MQLSMEFFAGHGDLLIETTFLKKLLPDQKSTIGIHLEVF